MKFSTLRDLGTGFLGFLFCLSLSVVLILNFRPLYVYEMKSENLASVSSMTEEEILEEYDALIRYNSLFYRGELTFPSLPMSEEGRIHFEEVKGIFDGIQILLILSALTFLPLAVFRIWKKQFGFLRVIPGISAIVALLAFLVTFLDWDALFTAFHQLDLPERLLALRSGYGSGHRSSTGQLFPSLSYWNCRASRFLLPALRPCLSFSEKESPGGPLKSA